MDAANSTSVPDSPQVPVMVIEGIYQGKNLQVQNPFISSGDGFCVTDVMVNEYQTAIGIESSAFEIDFQQFYLKIGDQVVVRMSHHPGCAPKVLNPEVLKPRA